MAIGIGATGGAGPAASLPETALLDAVLLDAVLLDPASLRGAGGAGAVATTGEACGADGATTVAPGPDNTRFTFKLLSGSMMTLAYNLRAVTSWMSSRSGSCWKSIPDTSTRSQLMKSSCNALSTVWRPATLTLPANSSAGFVPP